MYSDKFIGFGAIYSDLVIIEDNQILCTKYSPSYSLDLLVDRVSMNIPFALLNRFNFQFNEKIKSLFLWDGILSLGSKTLYYHYADTLFSINNTLTSVPIDKDMGLINELYFT